MYLYRILTENKNKPLIEKLVGNILRGFTIYDAIGYWKGSKELSLVIEVASDQVFTKGQIKDLANTIKIINQQENVLVQWFQIESELI